MMKRLISILMAITMIAAVGMILGACGESSGDSSATSVPVPTQAQQSTDADSETQTESTEPEVYGGLTRSAAILKVTEEMEGGSSIFSVNQAHYGDTEVWLIATESISGSITKYIVNDEFCKIQY